MIRSLIAVCVLANVASASPIVAVMPLRDLAGGKPNIGAALHEALSADLARTKGIRLVERAAIERVIREQDTHALEGVSGVRVGTLLGASHILTGAYQRDGERIRVTARVVVVETGVVAGSAKIDGKLDQLLELQDRLDAEILRVMGWKEPPPHHTHARVAPRAIELFGDAVLEPDVEKKKTILKQAVQASPDFSYATDALATLEGRLATYDARHAAVLTDKEQAMLKAHQFDQLLPMQRNTRRYHAMLQALDTAPQGELRMYYTFVAQDGLRLVDDALAAGEKLLAAHPDSAHYADVEKRMRELADGKRSLASGRADYDKDLAEKLASKNAAERDWGPCIAARWNHQYNQLMVDGCTAYLKTHGALTDADSLEHSRAARLFVVLASGDMGKFDDMRAALATFRSRYPDGDKELDDKLAVWPTD